MPLPSEIDKKVRNRFENLNSRARELAKATMLDLLDEEFSKSHYIEFHAVRVQLLTLIEKISPSREYAKRLSDEVKKINEQQSEILLADIQALQVDYMDGLLDNVTRGIEANITADYLDLAKQLYEQGKVADTISHLPAAVLIGAVFEHALRRLCLRRNPPVAIEKSKGNPKTLSTLIDDLKNAGLFNELKAKQLRAWADIRNAAAHGELEKFNREDVGSMIAGIKTFLAEYP